MINNAYGVYCTKIIDELNKSNKAGRVDIIVSSTDKNFMVPIGGSLIYSQNSELIKSIKKNYPGRASISPIMDIFITLLEMGKLKYKDLIKERKEKYKILKEKMEIVAKKFGERILINPNNKISIAMTLGNICKNAKDYNEVTFLGSLFYSRQFSGIKVITKKPATEINGLSFNNYGSSCQDYPFLPYMCFAAAIGISDKDINTFCAKAEEIFEIYIKSTKIDSILEKIQTNNEETQENRNFNNK